LASWKIINFSRKALSMKLSRILILELQLKENHDAFETLPPVRATTLLDSLDKYLSVLINGTGCWGEYSDLRGSGGRLEKIA
jgi:hypothetical protein